MVAYARRDIRGGAVVTALASGINSGDVSFTLTASTGWPDGSVGDFFVVIDRDTASEEVVRCASRTGTTVTVQTAGRGSDGTAAALHSSGAAVEHCSTALDDDEANLTVSKTVGKITTAGDMLVGDAANSFVRLANGTTGLPLVAGATSPSYTALGTSGIADDAVTGAKIVADAVGASEIAAGAVGTSELADLGVTTTKINDLGVTTGKLNDLAVTTGKINDAAVTSAKLASGVVDDSTIQFNSGVLRVKDAGITQAKFAATLLPTVVQTTSPTGVAGQLWFDSDDHLLYVYNGTAWVCITPQAATVIPTETSASTTYTNLTTSGPAVSIVTGTKALVTVSFLGYSSGTNFCYSTVAVSGATTSTAQTVDDNFGTAVTLSSNLSSGAATVMITGLTAGTNTFTMQYKVSTGTGSWTRRTVSVVGVP